MISTPFFPNGPTQSLHGPQRFVSNAGARGVFAPGLAIFSHGDNGLGLTFCNRGVSPLGVVSAVTADRFDAFVRGNMIQ